MTIALASKRKRLCDMVDVANIFFMQSLGQIETNRFTLFIETTDGFSWRCEHYIHSHITPTEIVQKLINEQMFVEQNYEYKSLAVDLAIFDTCDNVVASCLEVAINVTDSQL